MPTHPYLTQVVHSAARARPDQPCLIFGSRRTTNAQFRDRVARLAGGLLAAGLRPGDRVAIAALNSDRIAAAVCGCFRAGAAASPLNIRWTPAEPAFAASDCGASVLLADDICLPAAAELRDRVTSLRPAPPIPAAGKVLKARLRAGCAAANAAATVTGGAR